MLGVLFIFLNSDGCVFLTNTNQNEQNEKQEI